MKKAFLAVMFAFVTATLSFAQISTGDPTATKIKTGNRPQAGTFGLYGGAEVLLHGNAPYMLPVISLKYFLSDNLEIRGGLDIYSSSFSYGGRRIGATDIYDNDKKLYTQKGGGSDSRPLDNHFTISPGFAYHFSNSNILDVYVGAELPLGMRTYSSTSIVSGDNAATKQSMIISASPFHIGLNGIIGLQAFIGNLPLAVGFEYGLGMQADLMEKYRVVSVNGDNKATYYVNTDAMVYDNDNKTSTFNTNANKFASLAAASATLDHFFRLTLSYYFK